MAYIGIPQPSFYGFALDVDGRVTQTSNLTISLPAIANVSVITNQDYPVCLAAANSGPLSPNVYVSNTQLYFNPSTSTLTSYNFNSVSDVALKENIIRIDNPVSLLEKISGVEFSWKDGGKKASGFIAQEVQQTLPHLVNQTTDGLKTVNYQGIIAYLVETVKELNTRIKKLENKTE